MVDSVHRLRALVRGMRGYRGRAPSKQIFLRDTQAVSALRHAWQHLSDEMPKLATQRLPVLGRLAWISALDRTENRYIIGTFITGQLSEAGGPFPIVEVSDDDDDGLPEIALIAASTCVSLTSVYRACLRLARVLESQLAQHFTAQPSTMNDTMAFNGC